MPRTFPIDPRLTTLIGSVRSAIRRYVMWDGVLAILLLILSAFWIGLALDWLPVKLGGVEMPRSARAILLIVVAVVMLVLVYRLLLVRLWRPLPDDSLALLVERHHPRLGGRLVTAIQLTSDDRDGDSHDPQLLKHVHDEIAGDLSDVDANRIFQWRPIVRKAAIVGPMILAALGLLIASPQTFARAASRLTLLSDTPWPRKAQLEMVGIELPQVTASEMQASESKLVTFDDESKTVRLPRGSDGTLRIRAKADGDAVVPTVCTAYYETDAGVRGQANLKRVGREIDGFQSFLLDGPPLTGLSESMSISIRGLDDRLDDFRIEAIEPPAITNFEVSVRYPDYLRTGLPADVGVEDVVTQYQAGLRVREGSRVTITAVSSVPLGSVDALIEQNGVAQTNVTPTISPDGNTVRIRLPDFDSAATIRLVPADVDGISAQAPYRYFVNVIRDQTPDIQLKLSGIGSAVTAKARLPLEVNATDDYGITETSVQLATSSAQDSADGDASLPTELTVLRPSLGRDGGAEGVVDLRDLVDERRLQAIEPDGIVTVFAETRDGFDLDGEHAVRSEMYRLQVVTPEQLLALLERRELGLRSRLEQTIDETRSLRDALSRLDVSVEGPDDPSGESGDIGGAVPDFDAESDVQSVERDLQILRLRSQQAGLQAAKTGQELSGIVASLDDLLQEMVNNRVDSEDRRERIGTGVRDPLGSAVTNEIPLLSEEIRQLELVIGIPSDAGQRRKQAVDATDQLLLKLTAVLAKMLDMQSYNEVLDMVRGLIDDQDRLKDETEEQRKKRIQNFFQDL